MNAERRRYKSQMERIFFSHPPHIRRMGLIRKYKIFISGPQNLRNSAEIFFHRLPVVPSGKTEIQACKYPLAYASLSGGKTVVDGLITNEPGLTLSTFFADCVPLYFADTKNCAIGLSHSIT